MTNHITEAESNSINASDGDEQVQHDNNKACCAGPMRDAVVDGGKKTYAYVRDHVAKGAKVTDETVRKYPYLGVAAGVGIGAVIGLVAARLFSRSSK